MMSGTRKPNAAAAPRSGAPLMVEAVDRAAVPRRRGSRRRWCRSRRALRVAGSSSDSEYGHAVAELHRVGPEVLTGGAGVARGADVQVGVSAAIREHVEERLRTADREAGELDERAIPERSGRGAAAGRRRRGVLPAGADVGPQRAVFGLRAGVERDDAADPVVDVVGQVAGEPALAGLLEAADRRCRRRRRAGRSGRGCNRRP